MNYEDITKEQLIEELYRRDNLIKHLQSATTKIVNVSEEFRKLVEIKEGTINELLNKVKTSDVDIYNKEDIMKIFGVESDKALRILKMAMQMKYASKLGKEFIIKKESLQEFLKEIEGKDLKI